MVVFIRNKLNFIVFLILLLLACSSSNLFQPTATPIPTLTPTSTITPIPTETSTPVASSTPDTLASYLPYLPQKPEGFKWRIVPEVKVAVLIPDDWYFKLEDRAELGLKGFYVTKENIDEVGRFSTGFTLFVYEDFVDDAEADKFSTDLLAYTYNAETTKNVIGAWDNTQNDITTHFLRIEAEYPYETEVNRSKIVHYFTFAKDKKVYYTIFESPTNIWEMVFNEIGIPILDNFVLLTY